MLPVGHRLGCHKDFDAAFGGKLDGVGNQVRDALADAHGVEIQDGRQFGVEREVEFQPGFLSLRLPQAVQAAQRVDQVGVRLHDGDLAGFDLGQVEHVVQQGHQVAAAIEDGLHLIALLGGEGAHLQHLRHAENAVQRRADLVAHIGEEG